MKTLLKNSSKVMLGVALSMGMLSSANAGIVLTDSTSMQPRVLAGDEVGDRAPVVEAGKFTGVVSIQIEKNGGFFICSGSVIGKRHVITAAHCVDETGGGNAVVGGNVDVIFNDGGTWLTGSGAESFVTASDVTIHPDYIGFGVCGPGDVGGFSSTQCLQDDLAIIELPTDVPDGVEIYDFYRGAEVLGNDDILKLPSGDTFFTMVGHGTGGNGQEGFAQSPSYFTKRYGFNIPEIFSCDDGSSPSDATGWIAPEFCQSQYGNDAEVWYADFDGIDDADGTLWDRFCILYNVGCGDVLNPDHTTDFLNTLNVADIFEANIGGGDSGGPSFVYDMVAGKWVLMANNTFGGGGVTASGGYGASLGGNLYSAYLGWIDSFIMQASAPSALLFATLGGLIIVARRKVKA